MSHGEVTVAPASAGDQGAGTWRVSDQLYLQIRAPDKPDQQGTRSWLFRYRRNGKHHWMGIGSCELFSLADARARVLKLRQLLSDGVDPLAARREGRLNLSGTGPLLLAPEDVPSAEEPATKETAPTRCTSRSACRCRTAPSRL